MKRNTGKLYWAAIPENNNKKRRFYTAAFCVFQGMGLAQHKLRAMLGRKN